jgi:hypothetical protein
VKTAEKTNTLITISSEKGGVPTRKDRIRSEALLKGLILAKITRNIGNLPSLPSCSIREKG